jgi:hypothetical protein
VGVGEWFGIDRFLIIRRSVVVVVVALPLEDCKSSCDWRMASAFGVDNASVDRLSLDFRRYFATAAFVVFEVSVCDELRRLSDSVTEKNDK